MLTAATVILLLLLQTATAGSQEPQFETTFLSVFRAVSRGEAKKSLLHYETTAMQFDNLARSSDSPEKYWKAAFEAYRSASNTAGFLGNLQKAIEYGEKALALAEKLEDPRLKLRVLSTLVGAHRRSRNFVKMAEFIERGFSLTRAWPQNSLDWMWWHGVFYLHRGRDFTRRGEYEKAVEDFTRLIQVKTQFVKTIPGDSKRVEERKEHARTNMLLGYTALAGTYLAMREHDRALETYTEGLQAAKQWSIEFPQTGFYLGLGDIAHRRKDFAGALDHFHKALDLARLQQRPDVISNAARRIGDVLRDTGKKTEAIAFYQQAIQEIESIRSLLASGNTRQTYLGGWLGAYRGLTETLWETGAHDQAFHYGERVRSRAFLDMLGTKVQLTRTKTTDAVGLDELSDAEDSEEAYQAYLHKIRKADPERASLMTVEPLTLKQVQALLEPGQVLLEYLVTPPKMYLWVLDRTQVRAITIPVSQRQLAAKIEALRSAISELSPVNNYQILARELYEQLITPAGSFLRGKELIIVPHDVLHYLPFQTLYSPQGKYLVEDHSVTYLSSGSLLQFIKAKRKPAGQKVLAFGNPSFDVSKVSLPMSELETNEIRRLYPQSTIFAKSEANEAKAKRLAPIYDVLHFATHAELSRDDPLSSAVLLAKGGKEDGRLEVREIFGMDLNASLVVLSGCETGMGQLSSGDELVGLTRAFIYAGTPSVVASLWKVDDASTAHLMSSFYRNLKTKTKIESLREAQLDMIRGKVDTQLLAQRGVGGIGKLGQTGAAKSPAGNAISVSHPYFWAPFILVGDGK